MFSLICSWTNGRANDRDADDLRRHSVHYDITVMWCLAVEGGEGNRLHDMYQDNRHSNDCSAKCSIPRVCKILSRVFFNCRHHISSSISTLLQVFPAGGSKTAREIPDGNDEICRLPYGYWHDTEGTIGRRERWVITTENNGFSPARTTLQWRHNGCNGVSNHQCLDCLLNRLFRHRSKKIWKLRVTGLCFHLITSSWAYFVGPCEMWRLFQKNAFLTHFTL